MKNTVFPHKFWRPFLDCMPQLFFRPQYVWFPVHLKGHLIPLCYETLVVNWQNWLFTLFHQSRSVLSPNPIVYWNGIVIILTQLSSLAALKIVKMTFDAASLCVDVLWYTWLSWTKWLWVQCTDSMLFYWSFFNWSSGTIMINYTVALNKLGSSSVSTHSPIARVSRFSAVHTYTPGNSIMVSAK